MHVPLRIPAYRPRLYSPSQRRGSLLHQGAMCRLRVRERFRRRRDQLLVCILRRSRVQVDSSAYLLPFSNFCTRPFSLLGLAFSFLHSRTISIFFLPFSFWFSFGLLFTSSHLSSTYFCAYTYRTWTPLVVSNPASARRKETDSRKAKDEQKQPRTRRISILYCTTTDSIFPLSPTGNLEMPILTSFSCYPF